MGCRQPHKKLSVALIDPLGQYAGNHYYTDQLASGLAQAGAEVTVYAHTGEVDAVRDRPYSYVEPFHGIYGTGPRLVRGLRFVRSVVETFIRIQRRHTDVVHVQMWNHDFRELLQVALAKASRKAVVISAHEIHGWSSRGSAIGAADTRSDTTTARMARNFRWALSHADGVVVHNHFSLNLLRSSYQPSARVAVIPLPHVGDTAVGAELPTRAAARDRLRLPPDKTVLLFFGNCRKEKGLDLAMRAVSDLKDGGADVLLLTAGKMKPHEEAYYRRLGDELGLGNMLRMDVGLVPDAAAVDYYRAADAILVPYREIAESGVAITASSYARAVIASDLAPLLEATENGRLGLHFRNGDAHDLALRMKEATAMQPDLDTWGAAARDKVLRERDPDPIGKRMLALYRSALAGPGA